MWATMPALTHQAASAHHTRWAHVSHASPASEAHDTRWAHVSHAEGLGETPATKWALVTGANRRGGLERRLVYKGQL